MKVTVIYGNGRRGTTWRLTQLFLESLPDGEITEFFLPRDFGSACTGCMRCVLEAEGLCPHVGELAPILAALEQSDLIVLASPVYAMGMSGAMKSFLDHLAWHWTVHRPSAAMFSKVGVVISTAAGPCTGKTRRDLKQQLFFWGVPKTFSWGEAVGGGWDYMSEKKRAAMGRKAADLARCASRCVGRVKPGLKIRLWFWLMVPMHRHSFPHECAYWRERGWLDGGRPWRET